MTPRKPIALPRVVLVGRPNVGKSTLFNRVVGGRPAIVTAVPGTTRDVLREPTEWQGAAFELVDTGGLFGASEDPLQAEVSAQGLRALDDADLVLMLVDCKEGLVAADREVAARVRQIDVPVVLAVNKVDGPGAATRAGEFHELGFEPVLTVAAEHGLGVGDLLDEVASQLPGVVAADFPSTTRDPNEVAIAIVGRPNVGKSSLVNLLSREERVLVSEVAGTTRDAVDTVITWQKRRLRLVGHRRYPEARSSCGLGSCGVSERDRSEARDDPRRCGCRCPRCLTGRDEARTQRSLAKRNALDAGSFWPPISGTWSRAGKRGLQSVSTKRYATASSSPSTRRSCTCLR